MKKKWIIVGIILAAGALCAGFVAQAENWAPRFQSRPEFGMRAQGRMDRGRRFLALLDNDRVKSALGLTDDQVARLRKIVVDTEESSIKTGADLAVEGIDLREMLRADNPDHDAVMKKVDEIAQLRDQMMKQHVEALLAAKSVLTPEQQKKVRAFLESHRRGEGFREGGMGRHRGGGMGGPLGGPGMAPKSPRPPTN